MALDTRRLNEALHDTRRSLKHERISGYDVLEEISRGGNGVVVKARHRELGTLVALKLLLNDDPSAEARARFRREAQVLARLDHPNVVAVSDLGEENGVPFLAMELIVGRDLHKIARESREPLGYDWIIRMMTDVGAALQHCHEQGIVHRDVKPHNVLEEEATWRAVLTDFGLVRRDPTRLTETLTTLSRQASAELTQSGQIMGTPSFMAPEQLDPDRFGEVEARTDVWGWGATLYFLITGHPPCGSGDVMAVLRSLLDDQIPPARELRPDVPEFLDLLCRACLRKRVRERPAMREAVACMIERRPPAVAAPAAAAPPEPAPAAPRVQGLAPGRRAMPRRLVRFTLASLALLCAAGLYLFFLDPPLAARALARVEEHPGATATAIGRSYLLGELLGADPERAREWLELGAERQHAEAFYWLGHLHREGALGEPDATRALSAFQDAADGGYEPAMLWVARAHRAGSGTAADPARAVECYERAAQAADAEVASEAADELAAVIAEFRARADEGDAVAMLWTAYWLARGTASPERVPEPVLALHYYELARSADRPALRRRAEAGIAELRSRHPELR